VSPVEQPEESTVKVRPPAEALEHARRLPPRELLVIENVPEDEWAAFQEALADA